ncbi:hypothetical protein AUM47_10130 [Cronobacter malonaticus]|nr:hypothetical protein [Cronobacter malonaticus]HAU5446528.1 hypothetical protein [Cronobacter malonaticus]
MHCSYAIPTSALSANTLTSCWSAPCASCAANPVWKSRSLPRRNRKSSAAGHSGSESLTMKRCARLSAAMQRAAEKLRGEHQFCRYISVFVKTSPFSAEPYYGNHAGTKLLTPTQDKRDIITAATGCLDAVWRDGHRYQKAGVMLGDFFS